MKITLDESGKFYGLVSPKDYHDLKEIDGKRVLSRSFLNGISENPYVWKHNPEFVPTRASIHGSLVDSFITENEDAWEKEYVISQYEEFRSKESKIWKQEQEEAGLIVITEMQLEEARQAAEILNEFMSGLGIHVGKTHRPQVAMISKFGGYHIKSLMDLCPADPGGIPIDIKTTGINISNDRELRRHIYSMSYHKQAGLYSWQHPQVCGISSFNGFWNIFQNNTFPYICRAVIYETHEIRQGLQRFREDVEIYHHCTTTGEWPGKALTDLRGALPNWADDETEINYEIG